MILHGHKKRVLKDAIRYYVETTNKAYEDFILEVQKTKGKLSPDLSYSEWLSTKLFELLSKHEITIADCIENKDTIRSAIKEEESRQGGEFYTPEIWAVDGREYLKKALGDQWGKAYIWEASCGSGNLLRSIDYPKDKIFMSSVLPEDIELIKNTPEFEGVTAFQCDFVNDIDIDDYNRRFSEKLPPELVRVLENNEPIVFYMNPPYKVMEANSSDVGAYMVSQGMSKCALDIFHQFMYRLCMIKRFYCLTNVYLGIFGPVTMFHSKMLEPLYTEFKNDFKFLDGMCFDAGDFANTSESVGWIVGYTVWRTKQEGEEDKSIWLEAKKLKADDTIEVVGKRLITDIEVNLHDWVKAKDIVRYDTMMPKVTSFMNFSGDFIQAPSNILGYIMSSNYVIRATRRCSISSLPNPDNVPITQENFDRAVASFVARKCYSSKSNPYNNSQYCSMPDTSIEGYQQWLYDALVIFLFDYSAHQAAYRNAPVGDQVWTSANRMFPISKEIMQQFATDPLLISDLENNPAENQYILNVLSQVQNHFSPEAMELYQFCLGVIMETAQEGIRSKVDYAYWTSAWDASFVQLRTAKLLTEEQEERYTYLLSRLKHKLYDGVYKFGFMMDTAFATEDENEEDFEQEDEFNV